MHLSYAEENYLKCIYHLAESGDGNVQTNSIAEEMNTKAASVTDMIKKLANKGLLDHRKYQGVTINNKGESIALQVIRKHRLWEVFLVDKLNFNWDEVHDIAEQLEHIKSPLLIKRLDEFLEYPKFDPHGDPIPNEKGEFDSIPRIKLGDQEPGVPSIIVGLEDTSASFLKYLDKQNINIGSEILVKDRIDYDGSLEISIEGRKSQFISKQVADNILITNK